MNISRNVFVVVKSVELFKKWAAAMTKDQTTAPLTSQEVAEIIFQTVELTGWKIQ